MPKTKSIDVQLSAMLPFSITTIKKLKPRKKHLLKRDGNKCWLCGDPFDLKIGDVNHHDFITIDHIHRKRDGGCNSLANLKLAHRLCNNIRA